MIEYAELHITNACTHRCPYCYFNASMDPAEIVHADLTVIEKILRELKRTNVGLVALLGGDPVQHPEIVAIIKMVHDLGIDVSIMSNTMQIKNAEFVATMIKNIDATIHGRSAEEHDLFCGCKGAYDLLISNLKFYNERGIHVNVAVNIIPQTYNKIYEIIKGVVEHGVHVEKLLTQRILPYGRAEKSFSWNVSPRQVNIAFAQAVQAQKDFGIEISVEDPYPLCCIDEAYHQFMHGCPEGRDRIAIGMNGDITRCGAEPKYSKHNIITESLDHIWNNSDLFDDFRKKKYLPAKCMTCSLLEQCRGGCPISCEYCTKNNLDITTLGCLKQ